MKTPKNVNILKEQREQKELIKFSTMENLNDLKKLHKELLEEYRKANYEFKYNKELLNQGKRVILREHYQGNINESLTVMKTNIHTLRVLERILGIENYFHSVKQFEE